MEKYLVDLEDKLKKITKELDDKVYARNCFLDFIDNGAIFDVDKNGFTLSITTTKNEDVSKHLVYLSNLLLSVSESIDRFKIKVKCDNIKVNYSDSNIYVNVDLRDVDEIEMEKTRLAVEKSRIEAENHRRRLEREFRDRNSGYTSSGWSLDKY